MVMANRKNLPQRPEEQYRRHRLLEILVPFVPRAVKAATACGKQGSMRFPVAHVARKLCLSSLEQGLNSDASPHERHDLF